ncbi:MAG: methionyl-tRNA formyltransferase, partial [Parachlamydia sp.]|nr:methionyl-tRNA formyltransferase [Parachlamydia sp.]
MKVVYFGTPVFAAEVLNFLLENGVNITAVISKPDRPKGRSSTPLPTPVKEAALSWNASLPVFQPLLVSAPEFADQLKSFDADLFVVVAYGEIIKQQLLDMPKKACINLHASLLPKYRGAAPIQHSITKGEHETGVTIMHMVKKMDAGDMIAQAKVPITEETTYGELTTSLCEKGKHLLLEVIQAFESGTPTSTPQDPELVTMAPKIELEDCEIQWSRPAIELHNLVRGVNPEPGAWCFVELKGEKKRLKINRTKVVPLQSKPGLIISSLKGNLIIGTGDQALELLDVQLEGKKSMSS